MRLRNWCLHMVKLNPEGEVLRMQGGLDVDETGSKRLKQGSIV